MLNDTLSAQIHALASTGSVLTLSLLIASTDLSTRLLEFSACIKIRKTLVPQAEAVSKKKALEPCV